MNERTNPVEEYLREPVPDDRSVSGFHVALVCIGITITLPGLYGGGELAMGLGLRQAILAVLLGAAFLSLLSVPAAIVGAQTRLSSYMIIHHVFGEKGSVAVNALLGLVLLGWFAVTAEFFGRTLYLFVGERVSWHIPEFVYVLVSSAGIVVTTIYGFSAIRRLADVAVPVLIVFLAYAIYLTLGEVSLARVASIDGEGMPLMRGIEAVIGLMIVSVVLMPDLSRYSKSVRDCVVASFLGNGGGVALSTMSPMIPALAFGQLDPIVFMSTLGIAGVALAVLIFATWTTNTVNLYSTGLVAGAIWPTAPYRRFILVLGIAGTIVASVGIAERFVTFLVVIGLLIPPFAGVYLVDYFILKRKSFKGTHVAVHDGVNRNALLSAGLGMLAALPGWVFETRLLGIGAAESLLLASVAYWALERRRDLSSNLNMETAK